MEVVTGIFMPNHDNSYYRYLIRRYLICRYFNHLAMPILGNIMGGKDIVYKAADKVHYVLP